MGFHLLNRQFWLMTPTDTKTGDAVVNKPLADELV
ncbi:hypothetical protein VITU9109_08717 [Vibrio tubiashii ATCC 19109]|uniref:Transposase n=1 Tax=Vibrio tubiashii ATCC 19109 TaxID=1051646 RepID=A0ABP2LII3_9VIBR|nr:hypothetical protein VITU9109_08717 [Vibrio tubiashii ATCC 19109]